MAKNTTITGYSTALFSTWYFCDEMGVLFDCGDGVCSGILQKARKIKHVFVSHADRDHLAGLLQFNQLNGRKGLKIYYPEDCGSFPFLAEFSANFDPHTSGTQWIPIRAGDEITIRKDLIIRAIENRHVPTDGTQIKSLTYIAESISRKLKQEYTGRPGAEIGALRKELGEDAVSDAVRATELIYSGDTPIESDGRYSDAKVLIHEATFLTTEEIDPDNPKRNKHSSLEQVMAMVAQSNIEHLVLGHFSCRYSREYIEDSVKKQAVIHDIQIPISIVYPGEIARDILKLTLEV